MNIDLSKYEKMRENGASPLEVGKQLYADGERGSIEFFKIMKTVFGNLSLSEIKEINILSSGSTLEEWGKWIIDSIEQALDDEQTDTES